MNSQLLHKAVCGVPAGAWAVGVSGGADSTALLRLLHARGDLQLRVAHLNHQTRADQSDADADFVGSLAAQLDLPCETALRQQLEFDAKDLPSNRSARYRALRLKWFAS